MKILSDKKVAALRIARELAHVNENGLRKSWERGDPEGPSVHAVNETLASLKSIQDLIRMALGEG